MGSHLFVLGKRRSVAVGRGRGRVDDTLHLRVSRGYQHIDCAIHIRPIAAQRIQHGLWDGRNGSLVEHIIHALAGFVHGV